ncbi:MAG: T9SS type A sorting domain-containing protein [Bacteroidales bacterium]|nr:T9SS type A sorting domain-containing protein [Bacteroidales bacterium]HPE86352.1 T9SS type A sorting domain-containing protein [Bacteroidales bacterium]
MHHNIIRQHKTRLLFFLFVYIGSNALSQSFPPGWEFTITPSSHIFAIPESAWPMINSNPIEPGDYIGVFFDDNGTIKCGGAIAWPASGGTVLFAYGDDAITGVKDGFAYEEPIQWKLYSNALQTEVLAAVQLNPDYPTPGDVFIPEGMSGVTNISGGGFFVFAYGVPEKMCAGDSTQLHADAYGGSGNYSYSWTSEPPGFSSTLQEPMVQINDTTIFTVIVTDNTYTASDQTIIYAIPHPVVDAGSNGVLCVSMNYHCNATRTYTSAITWSTSGDGTFNFPHSPNAIYTPGENDIANGEATLFLLGEALPPCELTHLDSLHLVILPPPSANAGEDTFSCEESIVQLNGQAQHYASVLWTTSGSGSFSDPTLLSPVYSTGSTEEETLVTLTLEVTGNPPCGVAYDQALLTLYPGPECSAGEDQVLCENATCLLNATANHFTSLAWSSSGDGTFENSSQLNAEYFPGPDDILNGMAVLSLTVLPAAPCTLPASDSLTIVLQKLPEVFAGYDQTLCAGTIVLLTGYTSHTSSVQWSTSGDGIFTDATAQITTYTPGSQDIAQGIAILTFTGTAHPPCQGSTQDAMTIFLIPPPVAYAGDDAQICEGTPFPAEGMVENSTQATWSTSGTGTFADPTQFSTLYYPSAGDILAGSVVLMLTAAANVACPPDSDSMELSFYDAPITDAGEDQVISFGAYTQLEGMVTGGSGVYTFQWSPAEKVINPFIPDPTTVNLEQTVMFTLTATDANWGCISSDQMHVYVSGGPLSVTAMATPNTICAEESVQLQATPTGGSGYYTYEWSSDPEGFTSFQANPIVTPTETTVYAVDVSDGYNQSSASATVTVHEPPVANAGEDQEIFYGTSTLLQGNATGGTGNFTWQWKPAALVLNPEQQVTVTTPLYTHHEFTLDVMDQETGCTGNDEMVIEMRTGPLQVNPTATPDSICQGTMVQLNANASGGTENYTYLWYSEPPGYFFTVADPQVTPESSLRMWLETEDGANTASDFTDIVVFPENQVIIEATPNDTVCAGEEINLTIQSAIQSVSWHWLPGGETTPEITVDTAGFGIGTHQITAFVTDSWGCTTQSSLTITFELCTGIASNPVRDWPAVFPNPGKGRIKIRIPEKYRNGKISMVSITGKNTGIEKRTGDKPEVELNTATLHPGIYIIRIFSLSQEVRHIKVVIH